jgi:hypothetical protein
VATPDSLLLDVIRATPRRYRMPALPPDAAAAEAAGAEAALAFVLEQVRCAKRSAAPLQPQLQPLFTRSLARLVARALDSATGDPSFQSAVLAGQETEVAEHLALAATASADQRRVRAAIDAIAHPGKWQQEPAGLPAPLRRLHDAARAGDWTAVRGAALTLAATQWQQHGELLTRDPALARLERAAMLDQQPAVRRYLSLAARSGPPAGTEEATARGRAAARAGTASEEATVRVFLQLAAWLEAAGLPRHRVLRSLRPRSGLPRAPQRVKDEWDVALCRMTRHTDRLDLVLLAEAKASPASVVTDWPRLRRGLQRLADVASDADPVFSCTEGEVRITGASLRALAPPDGGLPPHVIYTCTGEPAAAALLSASARALLLQQPACLAYARVLEQAGSADADLLAPVWEAITGGAKLDAVALQYETARSAREAMLHPDDLLATATAYGSR